MKSLPSPGSYRSIKDISDLAFFLGIEKSQLNRWAYRKGSDRRYVVAEIQKRSGGIREIAIPHPELRQIQRAILAFLKPLYSAPATVHGFVTGKSIVGNASPHIRKCEVLKLDLKDFFPSISRRRIIGLFMARPFSFPSEVAKLLAHLCTFRGSLPQGAPTSPMISNFIFARSDRKLRAYAKEHRITYTRYADDLTFSSTISNLNALLPISSIQESDVTTYPTILQAHIYRAGFRINVKKAKLVKQQNRMCVTGLVVNRKVNVKRIFVRNLRVLLHLVEVHGFEKANLIFLTSIDERTIGRADHTNALRRTIVGRLSYIAFVKGKDDLVYKSLRDRWLAIVDPESVSKYADLRKSWRVIRDEPDSQRKGYLLEKLLTELCTLEGIPCLRPFKIDREQIDGMIDLHKTIYLVECKSGTPKTKLSEIDTLYGKLGRRPGTVRGVFLSMSGFDPEVVNGVREYSEKAIILWTSRDIDTILQENISFSDLMKEKMYQFSVFRKPLWHLGDGPTKIIKSSRS